jgi:hypothetical protein
LTLAGSTSPAPIAEFTNLLAVVDPVCLFFIMMRLPRRRVIVHATPWFRYTPFNTVAINPVAFAQRFFVVGLIG